MDRYRVVLTPDGAHFGILDREQYDYCGFPDESGRAERLTFKFKEDAQLWLTRCYRAWEQWEAAKKGTPPKGWRPKPPEPSPFDEGLRIYDN